MLNSDFTIISNNCWWWFVYEYLGLPYKSPFVWLFLFPECYLELLENFQYFISKELIFIKVTESKYYDQIKLWDKLGYPIGLLDGRIEIHFLHYSDEKESKEKWDRRKKRINYDNIIAKFSEWMTSYPHLIQRFDSLIFKNKICFSYNTKYTYKSVLFISKRNRIQWKDEWIETKNLGIVRLLNQLNLNRWTK